MPRRTWFAPLVRPVYLPTLIADIGVGVTYPIVALSAVSMGASAAIASLSVMVFYVGRLAGSAIAGGIAARRGATWTAMVGLAGMTLAALGLAASTALFPFSAALVVFGIAYSVFHVARQTQLGALVPATYRARGLMTLAGVWRIANFIGPVLGAIVIGAFGLRWAYVLVVVSVVASAVSLVFSGGWQERKHHVQTEHGSVARVLRENRRTFGTLGVAMASTIAVRSARTIALPLWAEHLGLSPSTASAIFAVSAAFDMVLFYPTGVASDRLGRRWSAIPSSVLLASGLLLIPFSTGVFWLTAAGVLVGLGNGWGSGLHMTLGADVAPHHSRALFLGAWSMIGDVGALVGPALISLVALASLAGGIFSVGVLGVGSTVMLWRWVPPGKANVVQDPTRIDSSP